MSPSADPISDAAVEAELAVPAKRRVVFVVGSGRSGTSTMSGALQTLGMHVPQPEVVADETNPKGFGEPHWVVDLHDRAAPALQRARSPTPGRRPGSRPASSATSSRCGPAAHLARGAVRRRRVAGAGPELVVKDPRLAWFLGLWRSAALRCEAAPAYVTMLRPVTEVVGSKQRYYATRFGEVNRTAAWVNMMLHTERATRGSAARVRPLRGPARGLDDPGVRHRPAASTSFAVKRASANDIRRVHHFIDPDLRRVQLTWDDVDVPARLRDIAEETWQALDTLADEGGDRPDVHASLDELRAAYAAFYEEAEAIASSSSLAARREGYADGAAGRPPPAVPRGRPDPARRPRDGAGRPPGAGCARPSAGSAEPDVARRERRHRLPGGVPRLRRRWPWTTAPLKPGLTCVFRVKNEARNLPWVLPPMFEAVQHVVLVDNQSDDGTPEVARRSRSRSAPPTASRCDLSLRRQPCRRRAPRDPARLGALADPLLQLVVRHVRTTYSMKWDGDMVLTREGIGRWPTWPGSWRTPARSSRCRGTRSSSRASRWPGSTSASSSSSRGSTRWARSSRS